MKVSDFLWYLLCVGLTKRRLRISGYKRSSCPTFHHRQPWSCKPLLQPPLRPRLPAQCSHHLALAVLMWDSCLRLMETLEVGSKVLRCVRLGGTLLPAIMYVMGFKFVELYAFSVEASLRTRLRLGIDYSPIPTRSQSWDGRTHSVPSTCLKCLGGSRNMGAVQYYCS